MRPHRGIHHRGYLPHIDRPGLVQFVTYRLADALPVGTRARPVTAEDDVDAQLDRGYGSCVLALPAVAEVVVGNWRHLAAGRYDLCAWVVMPNHVHLVLRVHAGQPLDRLVQSWKSYTAKRINAITGRAGRVWQSEYHDRYVRDEAGYAAALAYVENNPVAAGLCSAAQDWRWSSAWRAH